MKLKLYQMGEAVLRQRARPLTVEEINSDYIQHLIGLMKEAMHAAPGVGLAAPQIGESLQLAVLEDREVYLENYPEDQLIARERKVVPFQVIINPNVILDKSESVEFFEGCLSVAGCTGMVPRARKVTLECLNEKAEKITIHASGWHARILQHEIDHLFGTLYLDRVYTRTLMTHENYSKYWADKSIKDIKKILGV
ncbi:MAG TPA: peptide deformylase [Gammaproteobacteria bacterium]|nr:peptide deformylase [Gammaproteobacteria bacterium]